jgi:antitoxin ParD1/3/4
METMNISLPERMKAYVDSQIAEGRYSSASEYVRDLIRDDERRKAEEQLETLLLEGMRGEKSALTKQDFDDIRRDALARLKSRQAR